ncbi:hypothetical protein Q3G72_028084 [Acer saccharum]|nr:hypothetical protein Q3G72_028084 [Acer saccharum]
MKIDPWCKLCSSKAESSVHALWCCASLLRVRRGCLVGGHVKDFASLSFFDFVLLCRAKVDVELANCVAHNLAKLALGSEDSVRNFIEQKLSSNSHKRILKTFDVSA